MKIARRTPLLNKYGNSNGTKNIARRKNLGDFITVFFPLKKIWRFFWEIWRFFGKFFKKVPLTTLLLGTFFLFFFCSKIANLRQKKFKKKNHSYLDMQNQI
jgi:hypothetical protein